MYVIKLKEIDGSTINTDVEYTMNDGSKLLCRVSHFMPQSKEEVIQNIEQRQISEQARIDAQIINEQIVEEL